MSSLSLPSRSKLLVEKSHLVTTWKQNMKCNLKEKVSQEEEVFEGCPLKKKHQCTYCPYSTGKKYNLTEHVRIHTGEKPYSCPHCSFKCAYGSSYRTHLRLHTGERPYKCRHCSYSAAHLTALKSHLWTNHQQMYK